jgi:adenylate cyclase class 2
VPQEIEAKVSVDSPEAVRKRIDELGLSCEGAVFEINRLFDDAAGTLRRQGAALRVREEHDPESGDTVAARLTYKGPRVADGSAGGDAKRLKVHPEHEVTLDSAETMAAILEAVGLAETFRYEKRRTTWHRGDCEVTLDEIPHLGWFVEVEGPTPKAVRKVLGSLDLAEEPGITKSYIELLIEHLKGAGQDASRAVFEEG